MMKTGIVITMFSIGLMLGSGWGEEKDEPAALLNALNPPEGVIDMVLDSDMYNEVDDQFTLAFAVRSPERIRLKAINAAPFRNHRSNSPGDGMEKSYHETLRVLKLLDETTDERVFRGSKTFLTDRKTPVDSPAARHLIKLAHEKREGRLYVVGLGVATNIASALLLDPSIADQIVVVWIGGHPHAWPHARDFNLNQDIAAAQVLFDSKAPLIHVPAGDVAATLKITLPELEAGLKGKSPIADALYRNVEEYYTEINAKAKAPRSGEGAWQKIIWDIATVAWLLKPETLAQTEIVPSPVLTNKGEWQVDPCRHPIRVATKLDRDEIFKVVVNKLGNTD
ncbi:MAG: nucleoside hydrolase [Verrucomicrobiae bacterium]|nr:nucleoside hydrolase [Verrucomicrobiae bacterium]